MSKLLLRIRDIIKTTKKNMHQNAYNCSRSTSTRMCLQKVEILRPSFPGFKILALMAFFWPLKKNSTEEEKTVHSKNIENKIKEADVLFDGGQYNECYDILSGLSELYQTNVEILWRKGRVLYQLARQDKIDEKLKKSLADKAYKAISTALELNEKHFAVHKWMAVILDLKCSCESLRERVKHLEDVKAHMLRAIELNPNDPTSLYMLGEWCYRIADMPWYQRKIAKALFAEPPTSTYEEAMKYFQEAEMLEPRFYSMNLLMLGKTNMKVGREDMGKYYLNLALAYPARSNDDHQANKEAQELLKHYK